MCSCGYRGAGWNWSVTGTRQQKMAEKVGQKQTILHQFSSTTNRLINQQSINNQSDKMDYADVNDA